MDLPGEIRNKIYRFIPMSPSPQLVAWNSRKDISRGLLRSPIYRLNRQIRSEALSILCADQRFTVLNNRALDLFIETIGPSGRASLADLKTVITIGGDNYNYKDHPFNSLLQLNLQSLWVRLYFRSDPDFSSLTSQAMKWGRSVRDMFYRGKDGPWVDSDLGMTLADMSNKFNADEKLTLLDIALTFLRKNDREADVFRRLENGEL